MRKTTILLATISAFLVLSVGWLAPVQVKAYEMQNAKEIKNKMEEMGQNLKNDDNIAQLIDLHSKQEIENIFKELMHAETDDQIQNLVNQYLDIIGIDQLEPLLYNIDQTYSSGFNSIITSINNLFGQINNNPDIGDYRVEQVNGKLKITKLETIELKENTLIFTGEGNIIFPNGQTITQDIWQQLSDFCFFLSYVGLAVEFAGLIIEWIGIILVAFGFVELGDALVNFGFSLGMVGFVFAMVFLVLSEIFRRLADSNENISKTKNRDMFFLEKLQTKIINFLKQILQRITC